MLRCSVPCHSPLDALPRARSCPAHSQDASCATAQLLAPAVHPMPYAVPYRIHNADIHCADDYDIDDLVDVIEGSRVYIPAIYVINKIDQITIEELDIMDK